MCMLAVLQYEFRGMECVNISIINRNLNLNVVTPAYPSYLPADIPKRDYQYQNVSERLSHQSLQRKTFKEFQVKKQIQNFGSDIMKDDFSREQDMAHIKQKHAMTPEGEFLRRRERVGRVCSSRPVRGDIKSIFQHEETGTLYCSVPKTGCTFWKLLLKATESAHDKVGLSACLLVCLTACLRACPCVCMHAHVYVYAYSVCLCFSVYRCLYV